MAFSNIPCRGSEVDPLSTKVEKFETAYKRLKELQSLKDRLESMPKCGLRDSLLEHVALLLSTTLESHGTE